MYGLPAVNYLAVLLAAVGSMVVGYLWFGPLFGKTWMKMTGMKEMGDQSKMAQNYVLAYVSAALSAYVLAMFLSLTHVTELTGALFLAFWVWLGFQATIMLSGVLWYKQSWNLYFLLVSQQLVSVLVAAAILVYLG